MAVNKIIIGRVVGADGQQGAQGPQGIQGEQGKGFRYRGEWVANTQYYNSTTQQDVVTYEGSLYICLQTHQRNATPDGDTSYWGLAVPQGEKGESGDICETVLDTTTTNVDVSIPYNFQYTYKASGITAVNVRIPPCNIGYFSGITFKTGSNTTFQIENDSTWTLKLYQYGFETLSYTPPANSVITLLFVCDGVYLRCYIQEG